jgi:hypothetical protein
MAAPGIGSQLEIDMSLFEHTSTRRRAHSLCAVLVTMAAVTACGGDKNPAAPTPAPAPPAAPTSRTSQNPLGSATNVEARTSQVIPTGPNVPTTQVFDDFIFTGGANIRTVAWQGIYCVETVNAPAPAPTASAFVVSFYADQSGQPNRQAPLFSTTVPIAQTGETLDRTQPNLNCGTTPTTWAFYSYSVTLPNTFGAAANTRYWLSVQAVTPSFQTFWGWRDGTPDNRTSLQLANGNMVTFPVDRAYALAQ